MLVVVVIILLPLTLSSKYLAPTLAAGESFMRAAEIHMELETKHESASNLCEAAQVLKREDPRSRST